MPIYHPAWSDSIGLWHDSGNAINYSEDQSTVNCQAVIGWFDDSDPTFSLNTALGSDIITVSNFTQEDYEGSICSNTSWSIVDAFPYWITHCITYDISFETHMFGDYEIDYLVDGLESTMPNPIMKGVVGEVNDPLAFVTDDNEPRVTV